MSSSTGCCKALFSKKIPKKVESLKIFESIQPKCSEIVGKENRTITLHSTKTSKFVREKNVNYYQTLSQEDNLKYKPISYMNHSMGLRDFQSRVWEAQELEKR